MKGPSEAPPLIRRELFSDAYSSWSESRIDVGAAGRLEDHGDIQFDGALDPWDHGSGLCAGCIPSEVRRRFSLSSRWRGYDRFQPQPSYASAAVGGRYPGTVGTGASGWDARAERSMAM